MTAAGAGAGRRAGGPAKRVLLVSPDYRDTPQERPVLPIGLGCIAASVAAAGAAYEVSDLNVEGEDALRERIARFRPDVVGVRLISLRRGASYRLLREIRRLAPGALIVAGGPHLTADGRAVLEDCEAIDVGVAGEGERTMVELLAGASPGAVPGTISREGARIVETAPRPVITDLDDLPFPTYEGFPLERYDEAVPISSSRGCPYRCIFCGAPRILGRTWRRRSAAAMAEEVAWWVARGRRRFSFYDSNFAIDRRRVEAFCDEVLRRGWDATFAADGIRADHLDAGLLARMRAAQFTRLAIGVESGSDRVLVALRKGETRARIEAAIAEATRLGFEVTLFFIIGSPGETPADVEESFRLAERYPVTNVYFFSMTPIPGTEFYAWALTHGYRPEEPGRYRDGRFGFEEDLEFEPDAMTRDEARQLLRRARTLEERVRARWTRRHRMRRLIARAPGMEAARRLLLKLGRRPAGGGR